VAAETTFEYDEIGNITNSSSLGNYLYTSTKPHAVTTIGDRSYTYDAGGNMATAPGFTFRFNALNQLVDVQQTDGNIFRRLHLQFAYAATGERVLVKDGSIWQLNLGDAYRCDGGTCAKMLYGAEGLIGSFSSSSAHYVIGDRRGSTIDIVDAGGQLVQQYDYRPFGSTIGSVDKTQPPYRFTGKELDRSGLYYFGHRYYDSGIGRFISPDPLLGSPGTPASLNAYSYAQNNPVRFVDPSGLKVEDEDGDSTPEHEPEPSKPEKPGPEPSDPPTPSGRSEASTRSDRWQDYREPPERIWQPPPTSPGGAPNFEPLNGHAVSEDPVTSTAKLLATMFISRGPAFKALARSVAGGRFEVFAFVGEEGDQETQFGPATAEVLGLGGYSGKQGPFVGSIIATGPRVGTSTNHVSVLRGTEWVRTFGPHGRWQSTGITLMEGAYGEEVPGVEGAGEGAGMYFPDGEHAGAYGFINGQVFGRRIFFGLGGAIWP
jgi:RHS repeat-associated protein